MILTRLDVRRVRNIKEARLELGAGLNAIVGPNGSGKTSLLEALYLLGTGQSFRTVKPQTVVTHGDDALVVFGIGREDGNEWRIGVERTRGGGRAIVINGKAEATRSDLAKMLPMAVLTPESHRLVGGGPGERRAYVDWILFHVEQDFQQQWSVYQRALKQRNELLRVAPANGEREFGIWEEMLAGAGERIDELRRTTVSAVERRVQRYCAELEPEVGTIELRYVSGWASGRSLADALHSGRGRDVAVGYTASGPHRAEIRIDAGGEGAAETLSRGQEKALVVAMKLAAIEAVIEAGGRKPLLLFDDLPSELDESKRALVLGVVDGFGCQTVVTATAAEQLPFPSAIPALFHVEQGTVNKLV